MILPLRGVSGVLFFLITRGEGGIKIQFILPFLFLSLSNFLYPLILLVKRKAS